MSRQLDRLTIMLVVAFALVAVPRSVTADCPPDHVCTSGEAINAAADGLCRRARAAESRLGDPAEPAEGTVLYELGVEQRRHIACTERVRLLDEQLAKPREPARAPLWLRIILDVGVGATAAGTGTLAAVGAPGEVVVGFAVGSVGLLVSRLVLEVVW